MVTARKPQPKAPIAGDQAMADLAELLRDHDVGILEDNGAILTITAKRGGKVRRYIGGTVADVLRRAASGRPPDHTEHR